MRVRTFVDKYYYYENDSEPIITVLLKRKDNKMCAFLSVFSFPAIATKYSKFTVSHNITQKLYLPTVK